MLIQYLSLKAMGQLYTYTGLERGSNFLGCELRILAPDISTEIVVRLGFGEDRSSRSVKMLLR